MVPITQLPTRREARVERLSLDGRAARRLRELGVLPGSRVHVLARAPLGDPILIFVGGSRVAVRGSVASHILVRRAE